MTNLSHPQQAAEIIQSKAPGFKPVLGIGVGSGQGALVEQIRNPIAIPFNTLPGFPDISVAGHAGQLTLGYLGDTPVACLAGRAHLYEGHSYDVIKTYIRTLKLIGCESFLATNASGSLNKDIGPGNLMAINDHINFQFNNPLVGPNDDEFGTRFPPMNNAYDVGLRQKLNACAETLGIPLKEGVYIGVIGPTFETPAEIRAFKTLGADAVGMSTVADVIIANHCGLKVAVLATIVNLACGLTDQPMSHEETLEQAGLVADKLTKLVVAFAESLKQ